MFTSLVLLAACGEGAINPDTGNSVHVPEVAQTTRAAEGNCPEGMIWLESEEYDEGGYCAYLFPLPEDIRDGWPDPEEYANSVGEYFDSHGAMSHCITEGYTRTEQVDQRTEQDSNVQGWKCDGDNLIYTICNPGDCCWNATSAGDQAKNKVLQHIADREANTGESCTQDMQQKCQARATAQGWVYRGCEATAKRINDVPASEWSEYPECATAAGTIPVRKSYCQTIDYCIFDKPPVGQPTNTKVWMEQRLANGDIEFQANDHEDPNFFVPQGLAPQQFVPLDHVFDYNGTTHDVLEIMTHQEDGPPHPVGGWPMYKRMTTELFVYMVFYRNDISGFLFNANAALADVQDACNEGIQEVSINGGNSWVQVPRDCKCDLIFFEPVLREYVVLPSPDHDPRYTSYINPGSGIPYFTYDLTPVAGNSILSLPSGP